MKSIEQLVNAFNIGYAPNKDTEAGLAMLRKQGFSQLESVRALFNALGLDFSEADQIVLNSTTWAGRKQGTEQLRDNFFDALILLPCTEKTTDMG